MYRYLKFCSPAKHSYPILSRKSVHVTGMIYVRASSHNHTRINRISPDFDITFCHWSSRHLSCVASSRMPVTSAAENSRCLPKVTEAFRTAARMTERFRVPDILHFEFWNYFDYFYKPWENSCFIFFFRLTSLDRAFTVGSLDENTSRVTEAECRRDELWLRTGQSASGQLGPRGSKEW